MDRRRFLLTSLAGPAAPLAADAQQAGRVWRIGWLGDGTRSAREANTLSVAKKATSTLPIVVATVSDFIGGALVRSLACPGGNLTGTNDEAAEIAGNGVQLLAEVVPRLGRVALLWDSSNPGLKTLPGTPAVTTGLIRRDLARAPYWN